MSWDSWITSLTAHEQIAEAAIWCRLPGKEAQWATSAGLSNISVEEIKKLACENKESLRCSGPCVGGMKCMFIRDKTEDPQVFSLDLKSLKNEQGETFCVCVGVSLQTFVIAKGTRTSNGGVVSQQVYKTVKCLREAGL